ncbi:MAG: hypothetical protein DRI57_21495 [Deltaproteobacteria bacterium]|nr:MAG: hypothetical protein DRI57_21495 [Deltaproteobacteria bacterium]
MLCYEKPASELFQKSLFVSVLLILCLMSYSFAALLSSEGSHVSQAVRPEAKSGTTSVADAEKNKRSDADSNASHFRTRKARSGTARGVHIGEHSDMNGGLYNLRARQYDPGTGRFLTPDSWQGDMSRPATLNRYAYAEANPVNRTDPSGHFSIGEINTAFVIRNVLTDLQIDTGMNLADAHSRGQNGEEYIGGQEVGGLIFSMATGINPRAINLAGKTNKKRVLKGILKGMSIKEAKFLMSKWDKSTYPTLAESIRDHANRHGFGHDIPKYLRKPANFNKRRVMQKKNLDDGAVRWTRADGEFLIERNGKIVTYGYN